jgi:hypothetical protein
MDKRQFENGLLKFSFNAGSRKQTLIVEIGNATAALNAAEANDLLDWLYQNRDTLFQLAYMPPDKPKPDTQAEDTGGNGI